MLRKSKMLLAFVPFMLASCGPKITGQVKFGYDKTFICSFGSCEVPGYETEYAYSNFRFVIPSDCEVTIKSANISITTSDGTVFAAKGFATFGDSESPQKITAVATEYKISDTLATLHVMFDYQLSINYNTDTAAKAKVNNTRDIPFNVDTDVGF